MLICDCETLTGAHDGQALRFGCFQERGWRYDWRVFDAAHKTLTRGKLDYCWNSGIFYEPEHCTPEEIEIMTAYCKDNEIKLYTREQFIKFILFRNHWVKRERKSNRELCDVWGERFYKA
jgi:hypothetical protein